LSLASADPKRALSKAVEVMGSSVVEHSARDELSRELSALQQLTHFGGRDRHQRGANRLRARVSRSVEDNHPGQPLDFVEILPVGQVLDDVRTNHQREPMSGVIAPQVFEGIYRAPVASQLLLDLANLKPS